MSSQVSVVVPCFNLGRYVDEAVQSCLQQSHPDVEIIVVDDGSTEQETSALLATYTRPHTRVVRTANNGLAAARNHGASLASGQYLCFLDADDWLAPTYFEKAVSTFNSQRELSFVGSWVQATGEEDWLYTPDHCDLPALLADCTVSTAAVVRQEAFWSVEGFDTGMPAQGDEDWDLWINLAAHGHVGTILPEALFFYRRRSGSMVEQAYFGDDHLSLAEYMFHKYRDHYDLHRQAVSNYKQRELDQLRQNHQDLLALLVNDILPQHHAAELARSESIRHALEIELEQVKNEVSSLRDSGSWRITAPLRWGLGLLRRGG